jgi:hypothetical protein
MQRLQTRISHLPGRLKDGMGWDTRYEHAICDTVCFMRCGDFQKGDDVDDDDGEVVKRFNSCLSFSPYMFLEDERSGSPKNVMAQMPHSHTTWHIQKNPYTSKSVP